MLNWLRKLFTKESTQSKIDKHEKQQIIRMHSLLRDDPATNVHMEKLARDFEKRSLKQTGGHSSSSPIS